MTFEEIREMVNATITENGQRQITGKALNLALLAIITAMEEQGSGAENVYVEETLTLEHQAVNAATYAKCKANVAEDKALPAIVVDVTQMMATIEGAPTDGFRMTTLPLQVMFIDPSSPSVSEMGVEGLACAIDGMNIFVNEDGSIVVTE